jgi:hypothetical protein
MSKPETKWSRADDVGRGPIRLHGAQDAEIVLGVLQVVLGQHPVARDGRVTRQLLVLFEDAWAAPRTLTPSGPFESNARLALCLLRLAAAAAAIAAALTLHTLEISHVFEPVRAQFC